MPCNIRREGGQSLVIRLEGREGARGRRATRSSYFFSCSPAAASSSAAPCEGRKKGPLELSEAGGGGTGTEGCCQPAAC